MTGRRCRGPRRPRPCAGHPRRYPHHRAGCQEPGPLTHELAVDVTRLPELSVARQRHVAALLTANRIAFPEEDLPREP